MIHTDAAAISRTKAGGRKAPTVAFLGTEGSFAHFAAKRRYGSSARFVSCPTIKDVFDHVMKDRSRLGIVPVENSSGGTIYETVDRLVDPAYELFIHESLSVNVRLALLGRTKENIKVIYSFFAPMNHCAAWLDKHYPLARRVETANTTTAARLAAQEPGAAAIASRMAADIYKLNVLAFPVGPDVVNLTQFFVLGHQRANTAFADRVSIVVTLRNEPGALHRFLGPFARERVDLSRILSRPIMGSPNRYFFLVDIVGNESDRAVQRALREAQKTAQTLRRIGSYPVRATYES